MKVSRKGKYYGSKHVELTLDQVVLSQYDYTIKTTPWHYHENPYFMLVLHGNMLDCNKKVKSLLPAGDLMFNNWQEQHQGIRHSTEATGFHLEFERRWLKRNAIDIDIFEGSQKIDDPNIQLLISKIYSEFLLLDKHSELSIDLLLLQICDALSIKKSVVQSGIPSWAEKLKEILHFENDNISLTTLSEELGVHPVHISRAVPKYFSVSLGEYLRKIKLQRAMRLLLSSDKTLTEIAHQAGFSDQSNFNHNFKRYYEVTPGYFRKMLKR